MQIFVTNRRSAVANLKSRLWELTRHFFIHSPHHGFSLLCVRRQLLVLLKLHHGRSLIFRRPSRDLILESVACVDKYLPHAVQSCSSFPGIFGNGTMAWHEDIGSKSFDRVKDSQP